MRAFANGLSLGADGIELDVHLSQDGVAVVHHDATVDRTTSGRGAVSSLTAAELARLDVPALSDVLAVSRRARHHRAQGQPEGARAGGCRRRAPRGCRRARVPRVVRPEGAQRGAGRGAGDCDERRARGSAVGAVSIVGPPAVARRALRRLSGAGVLRHDARRVAAFVELAHRAGLGVQVWTVDSEDDARRLLDWGVDALITDRPDELVPLVRAR